MVKQKQRTTNKCSKMRNYLISIYVMLGFVLSTVKVESNSGIVDVDVDLIVSPKEAKGNSSIWSVLSRIDQSTSLMTTTVPTRHTALAKKENLVDYFLKPSLFFKKNNFTNLLKATLTYSNANSICKLKRFIAIQF